jgi:hypothetical protein
MADLTLLAAIAPHANLSNADLHGADLHGADLHYANLGGADLHGANLSNANLRYADLSNANLYGANLRYADLGGANLSGANLSNADLSYADLSYADLSYADLGGADLGYVIGNMREVKSAQVEIFPLVWYVASNGEQILQIGCQGHPVSFWEAIDAAWLKQFGPHSAKAWWRLGPVILALVKASPAG